MKWIKRGRIFGPSGLNGWDHNSALQPTPHLRSDGIVRVFCGFRDASGVGRVGYVDVEAENPGNVVRVSRAPVLDIGRPGAFDENGVVPCAIVEKDGQLRLYYAGYQLGQKVRFYVFGGLAISSDGGETFTRYSEVPICDRTDDEMLFKVVHSVLHDRDQWRMWYGGGSHFDLEDGRQLPRYNIRTAVSSDGLRPNLQYSTCIDTVGDEYRVGRPYVIKHGNVYKMFYGAGTAKRGYRLAYAESSDGLLWERKDGEVGIDVSESGWDSEMQAYPAVVSYRERTYLFYNGNNYGEDGFGYAELDHW